MEGVWREQAMLLLGLSLGLREPKSRRNGGEDCCEEDERKPDLKAAAAAAAAEAEEAAAILDDTMGKSLLRVRALQRRRARRLCGFRALFSSWSVSRTLKKDLFFMLSVSGLRSCS